jgi:hypothetical protein
MDFKEGVNLCWIGGRKIYRELKLELEILIFVIIDHFIFPHEGEKYKVLLY